MIKYGGGDDKVKEFLATASQVVINDEEMEMLLSKLETRLSELERGGSTDEELDKFRDEAFGLRNEAVETRQATLELFRSQLAKLDQLGDEA